MQTAERGSANSFLEQGFLGRKIFSKNEMRKTREETPTYSCLRGSPARGNMHCRKKAAGFPLPDLENYCAHRENRSFLPAFLRPVEAGRLEVGVSSRFSGSCFSLISTFSDLGTPFCRAPFLPALAQWPKKKRGGIFVVHLGNCFARPCSPRLERNAGADTKSHFSAAPAPTRPRAPQKQKAATARSPPPLL